MATLANLLPGNEDKHHVATSALVEEDQVA